MTSRPPASPASPARPDARWDILTGEPERDRRNVGILMDSVEEFFGPKEPDELARHVVDRAIRVTGAKRGILLLEGKGPGGAPALEVRVARGADGKDLPLTLRYSRTVVEQVRKSGVPHLTVDAEDPMRDALGQSVVDLRLLSIMAVPLPLRGRSLGVLYVDSTLQAKEFTKADFSLFRTLGGLIALAVENGRLVAERVEKERMARELAVAREIQMGLFPKNLVAPPGFHIAADGRPCAETSGDYYDVIPLPDGRVVLVMGDVSGHGLGPALWMTSTRALLHAFVRTLPGPVEVVAALNAALERDLPPTSFVSLFLGVLDPARRTLEYVNAGHPPALLRRADGRVEELAATGRVLGITADAAYGLGGPVALGPGDVLVLYTDGITEARNAAGEMYEERFPASLLARAPDTRAARDLLDAVLGDLVAWSRGREPSDDVTCLVARVDR